MAGGPLVFVTVFVKSRRQLAVNGLSAPRMCYFEVNTALSLNYADRGLTL